MHNPTVTVDYHPDLAKLTCKKRVCAYARVSSEKEEAFHSLSAQISYYQTMIAEHSDWEFVEVFADRGITGTKETREGFQRMLTACREGKVDIVLTKSISRFARNTVILLETIRELKGLGVDIRFEEEHINTLSETGEFMISILAARAQEESRQVSENQKWRIQKLFQKGIPVSGECLGYRLVDGQFLIESEEEPIVRRIFSMYLSGMGKVAIAKQLNEEKVKNRFGKVNWTCEGIRRILTNEIYHGKLFLQKSYRQNYVSKKKMVNKGERPMYLVENALEPIVTDEVFEETQREMERRAKKHNNCKEARRYPFSGLIRCAQCGSSYCRKTANASSPYAKPAWSCAKSNKLGKKFCSETQTIPEKIVIEATCQALNVTTIEKINIKVKIVQIIADKHVLTFQFTDGTQKSIEWSYPSRSCSWTQEMREAARQRMIERNKNKQQEESNNGS